MRAVPLPSSSSAPATSAPPAAATTTVGTLKEKALGLIDFFTRVYTTADGAGFLQLGAAIAFHILLAVGPLVVVILAAAGIFLGDDAAQGRLFGELAGLTGESGAAPAKAPASPPRSASSCFCGPPAASLTRCEWPSPTSTASRAASWRS